MLVEAVLALVAVSSPLDAIQPALLEERVHMEQAAVGMQQGAAGEEAYSNESAVQRSRTDDDRCAVIKVDGDI